ncbi:heavy metal translocating P-type ATPase [Lujinxingia vulgaris]|uniref:Heavy metal translocating P-type ATPase n=1 Tax=Lujinxingia vulgaris TaxID=2600176 RepID=A0A5C6XD72_9DELT|nr:heavy metal translocating P-type ATPase [Lujinxingia vulgaris]TXD35347.1 heavy metal translocating P-type ATPase [Lujinxingia vulgaris]
MTEKLRLKIPVLLPEVTDERDQCLTRMETMLGDQDGITEVHVVTDTAPSTLCIHYEPGRISLQRVRELAEAAGARLTKKYGHFLAKVSETSHVGRARSRAERLRSIEGVLEAEVSGAGGLRVEYDRDRVSEEALRAAIGELGLHLSHEYAERRPGSRHERAEHVEHDHGEDAHPEQESEHAHRHGNSRAELGFAIASGVFLLIGWLLPKLVALPAEWMNLLPLWAAYGFGGFFTAREAFEHIRNRTFEIDFLMLVAAIGAAILGQWVEGGLLLFLFSLGHSLEHFAMARARRAIESLSDLTPQDATVIRNGSEQVISVDDLQVGDRVRIKPNKRVPADGFVVEGESAINQAPVTGESVPVDKRPVDEPERAAKHPESIAPEHRVFAGTINGEGALTVQVTKRSTDSALARVVQMVTEAETMRSPTQEFTATFERYFVPSVLALVVLLLFAFMVLDETFSESFYRAMAVLVAASPCALAIATPSAVLSSVAAAGKSGVLVKGGAPLEHLGQLSAIAFDKTGTLTEGEPRVTSVEPYRDTTSAELLSVAVAVERLSDHPLAAAIVRHGEDSPGQVTYEARELKSVTGRGVRARIQDEWVLVGKEDLFDEAEGEALPDDLRQRVRELETSGQTTMIVRRGERYLGAIGLMDTPRETAAAMITRLRELGITRMIMISGDNQSVADAVAKHVGLDEARGDLMPDDKVRFIKDLAEHGKVAMVGDGVNDAPAMANATVGIAMGAAGSDTALETAQIALMADDLSKLPYAVGLSRKTSAIIRQNLWMSLGMVAFLIPATLLGLNIGPAVALHEGSTVVVVFNALRLLAYRDSHS